MGLLDRALNIGEGKMFKRHEQRVALIGAYEPELELDTDAELRERIDGLRARARDGESLDDLLPETFAIVREVGKRRLDMRHFDVQLIGGMVLHGGSIAEMRTGEGKTLTATLAVVLNALRGDGVHVVTVNDYLARRDAEWMAPVYEALGVSVGVIQSGQDTEAKSAAYGCDVTYGTNSEFGFDYLRDNMAQRLEDKVQHGGRIDIEGRNVTSNVYAIVDEVDNILIDEARTPLIISGAPTQAAELYVKFARLAPQMILGKTPEGLDPRTRKEFVADFDYEIDEKHKTAAVTELGVAKAERFLGIDHLYRAENGHLVNHLIQALRAQALFKRDVDYAVIDGEVKIVDEFTGRILEGRRWSEGLHQAIEAKEGVAIREENQTLATITLQNYFRLYGKLAGHDRHGAHGGNRVHEDLRAAGGPDPDQRADDPRGPQRPSLQDQGRQMVGGRARDRRAQPQQPAGSRRHDLGRGLRAPLGAPAQARHRALRAEREARACGARG